jgi:hypothetical protein
MTAIPHLDVAWQSATEKIQDVVSHVKDGDASILDATAVIVRYARYVSQEVIDGLSRQLAAQRAIVAADDEYERVKYDLQTGLDEELAADAARATARENAKRIDEVK